MRILTSVAFFCVILLVFIKISNDAFLKCYQNMSIEMKIALGGREGNNAFLKYGSASNGSFNGLVSLVESGFSYKDIVKLSKEPDINMHAMDGMVVVAARVGLRELASAIAEGPARCNMNDLHRLTLTDASLPQRILPISVLKKGYGNANITPLHTAAINPNILERLRTIQPNINIPDSNNWYTIHYAAVCEGAEPLKFLLRNGITPSVLNKQNESPLHVAARAGRKETIKVGFEERKIEPHGLYLSPIYIKVKSLRITYKFIYKVSTLSFNDK
ncbi:unnamed protein product [Angiostrongylus costaricensis]|uniref:ANK_REP_REGION domain-containing protein n=1 Tax=Angiostrongylus costaricensis TaxID=334426 RepID=A0A0R3PGF3_ANGCS|nr:unnamed protein product [Angiostrongylus costaricensis]